MVAKFGPVDCLGFFGEAVGKTTEAAEIEAVKRCLKLCVVGCSFRAGSSSTSDQRVMREKQGEVGGRKEFWMQIAKR